MKAIRQAWFLPRWSSQMVSEIRWGAVRTDKFTADCTQSSEVPRPGEIKMLSNPVMTLILLFFFPCRVSAKANNRFHGREKREESSFRSLANKSNEQFAENAHSQAVLFFYHVTALRQGFSLPAQCIFFGTIFREQLTSFFSFSLLLSPSLWAFPSRYNEDRITRWGFVLSAIKICQWNRWRLRSFYIFPPSGAHLGSPRVHITRSFSLRRGQTPAWRGLIYRTSCPRIEKEESPRTCNQLQIR